MGFGSFYTENIGTGIAALILWPLSIFWDPVNGHEGALYINYRDSKLKYRKAIEAGENLPLLFPN